MAAIQVTVEADMELVRLFCLDDELEADDDESSCSPDCSSDMAVLRMMFNASTGLLSSLWPKSEVPHSHDVISVSQPCFSRSS
jgi:hypothetical protein